MLTSLFNILKEVISRPLIIGKSHSSEGTTKCTEVRCECCSLIFSGESSAKSGRECFNRSAETFSRLLSREWWSAKIARMIGAASVRISPVLAISRSLCIKQAVSPSHLLNLYWDVLLRFPLANPVWNHWQKLHCIGHSNVFDVRQKKIDVYIFNQFTNRYDFYEKAVTFKPYQVRPFASILSCVYNS